MSSPFKLRKDDSNHGFDVWINGLRPCLSACVGAELGSDAWDDSGSCLSRSITTRPSKQPWWISFPGERERVRGREREREGERERERERGGERRRGEERGRRRGREREGGGEGERERERVRERGKEVERDDEDERRHRKE